MPFTAAGNMTRAIFLKAYFSLRDIFMLSLSLFELMYCTPSLSIMVPLPFEKGSKFSYLISMFKGFFCILIL